ncbi:MAG: hypothetical protein GVY28_00610 [Alphaproteobacteria bacterium]|jgi:hypothetical protein|nr:hypothetical protein [Alphaproteobacteria bacterium]
MISHQQAELVRDVPTAPLPVRDRVRADTFLVALAEASLADTDPLADTPPPEVLAAAAAAQRRALPFLLPQAMQAACLLLDLSTLRSGRRFRNLPLAQRIAVLQGWRRSRLAALRGVVKFHEVYIHYVRFARMPAGPS